jgi:hypothetical protein
MVWFESGERALHARGEIHNRLIGDDHFNEMFVFQGTLSWAWTFQHTSTPSTVFRTRRSSP